ncbi:hypothetical protein ABZW49_46130 [Nonomuraea wenchangensis]
MNATPGLVHLVRVGTRGTPDADRGIRHLATCLTRSIGDILDGYRLA